MATSHGTNRRGRRRLPFRHAKDARGASPTLLLGGPAPSERNLRKSPISNSSAKSWGLAYQWKAVLRLRQRLQHVPRGISELRRRVHVDGEVRRRLRPRRPCRPGWTPRSRLVPAVERTDAGVTTVLSLDACFCHAYFDWEGSHARGPVQSLVPRPVARARAEHRRVWAPAARARAARWQVVRVRH